jgi:TolA-binding protein
MNTYDAQRAADALYACGHALFSERRYSDAATVFRALAAAVPSDERGWLGLGSCHEAIDQHGMAIEMFRVGQELSQSTRCAVARARALKTINQDFEVALDDAEMLASGNDELETFVRAERRAS